MLGVTSAETLTAIYDAARYDDYRDVITCVTLSDTRPVARKEYTCGGCKKTIPVGARHRRRFHARRRRAGGREDVPRLRVLPTLMATPQGVRAVTPSPATAGGSCLAVSLVHTADVASG